MAYPTPINSQITDAISQVNVKVLGDAPAVAMGNLFLASAQALSNAAHNATNSQPNTDSTFQAASAHGASLLYSSMATGLTMAAAGCSIQASLFAPSTIK